MLKLRAAVHASIPSTVSLPRKWEMAIESFFTSMPWRPSRTAPTSLVLSDPAWLQLAHEPLFRPSWPLGSPTYTYLIRGGVRSDRRASCPLRREGELGAKSIIQLPVPSSLCGLRQQPWQHRLLEPLTNRLPLGISVQQTIRKSVETAKQNCIDAAKAS